MKTKIRISLMIAVLLSLTAVTAFAVGKSDVRTAFGWNNAQLQANIGSVTFTYISKETYDVTMEWTIDQSNAVTRQITKTKSTAVNSEVLFNSHNHKQAVGIFLTGFGATTVTVDEMPVFGVLDAAGGLGNPNPTDNEVIAVTLISYTGGLYATYNGVSVLLY